jgi:eukaryotic-like serine/threonine-protein kinase
MKALVCPRCKTRYDDTPPAPATCPRDQTRLVRFEELLETTGDAMLGRTLDGRFTILARLGAGSMGTVYRARQHAMGRDVAIKILRSDKAVDEQAKGRFLREARANSLLASPHTVTVFDFGQAASGELFLAMELLEGESLGQRIARLGSLPLEQALETCRQALRSLGEAHAKGIIHRDLKPDNLFYSRVVSGGAEEEIVKVLDFGIAKVLGDNSDPMNAVETQAGTVFGTPRYMSPEQAQGKPLDGRSDLYALGVILYHMLTGRPPYTDDDAIVVMARHIKTPPPTFAAASPGLKAPPDVEALVMRLLSKEPSGRPGSADAMLTELARLAESGVPGTSGVRISVSTIPPFRSSGAPGSIPPSQGAEAAQSLSVAVAPSPATLELAGVPRRTSWAVVAVIALAVFGITAFAARQVLESRRTADAPQTPTAEASARPAGPQTPISSIPPPPEPETAAAPSSPAAPAQASNGIPSVSADELPKAATTPAGTPRHTGRGQTKPPSNGGTAKPAPAPAASQGYGLLE